MNKELAKTLTTALVQFIDRERPEGTMCCSNYECERIEKAFMDDRLDVVDSFIQKKLSRLTEFENEIQRFSDACAKRPTYIPSCGDIRRWSSEILSLAREQLIKDGYVIEKKAFHDAVEKVDPEVMKEVSDSVDKENELSKKYLEGYIKGREDTLREMKDFIESHFKRDNAPSFIPYFPTYKPNCWEPGGLCTNPMRDCINCPRMSTMEMYNTTCGTSTAIWHGNTSATDGKEHNPSFTD